MVHRDNRGVGLIEILIAIPIFTLFIAGTLLIYKIIESKNMAINDSLQINLMANRLKEEIRVPLSSDLTIVNEKVKIKRSEKNKGYFSEFRHGPLAWQSEVEVAFTPKKTALHSAEELKTTRFRERNLLLIEDWGVQSKFGKNLKKSIDLYLNTIFLSLFLR